MQANCRLAATLQLVFNCNTSLQTAVPLLPIAVQTISEKELEEGTYT
jgi:hypothetical protein